MEIHNLYSDWSHMKSSVVRAAAEFLENRDNRLAEQTLKAMLIAEANARTAFEEAYLASKKEGAL